MTIQLKTVAKISQMNPVCKSYSFIITEDVLDM